MAKLGPQQRMSWAPENKALVLLDLCCEGHSECITDQVWSIDTTLISLAESAVVFFSGVVKKYRKGYFRYAKKMDYNIIHIRHVEIIHAIKYANYNFN